MIEMDLRALFWLAFIGLTLGLWKAIEIIWWLAVHIRVVY